MKISNEVRQQMRDLYATGHWTQRQLSLVYQVSQYRVQKAVTGVVKRCPTMAEHFWKKVDIRGDEDCWEWRHALNGDGYGNFHWDGKTLRANRVAYELTYGTIPPNAKVRHRCDNSSCVNPNHLEVGTQRDNIQDMVERGRAGTGKLKLSTEEALEVRRYVDLGLTRAKIAKHFNVSGSTIARVLREKRRDSCRRDQSIT